MLRFMAAENYEPELLPPPKKDDDDLPVLPKPPLFTELVRTAVALLWETDEYFGAPAG